MRIQHNISAMNSYRNFSANNSALSKNLEKLSTGYKINRAGDDAAGLAISEKMRAQISGLEGATKNAKDGISLVQTAEGALTEVHDMLNRMTTLAEQSANGTYQDELDREQLQKEIGQLQSEIDRIADSTNFNGLKLLDGSLAENTAAVNNETQLSTIKASTALSMTQKFENATGDSFDVALGTLAATANKFSAIKLNFSDETGAEYELTLQADVADSTLLADGKETALIAALNGGTGLSLSVASEENQNEALTAFREIFTVSDTTTTNDSDGTIKFTVDESHAGAKLTAVSWATKQDSPAAAVAALTDNPKGITKTAGKDAGYEITIGAASGAASTGKTVSIGDRVYEFADSTTGTPTTAGAKLVANGASAEATAANLAQALKNDGYDVTVDGAKIRFTDLDQISEAQAGAAVSVSSTNLAVQDQEASKQTVTFTATATTGSDDASATLTVNYIDSTGENKSKTISYKTSTTQATNAQNIYDALNDDEDLNSLFSVDKSVNTITITARSTDNSVGQLVGLQNSDSTETGIKAAVYTAGVNDGKAISLKDSSENVKAGDTVTINGTTYEFAASGSSEIDSGNIRVLIGSTGMESMENLSDVLTDNGVLNSYNASSGSIVMRDTDNILEQTSGGLRLQIGDTADSYNKLTVSVSDMHAASLGIGTDDIDISTQDGAAAALDKIKAAVNKVSDVRGNLGALQNRLDHTINNLGVMRENIQNAESQIRDTDVAEEMMTYTKNSILNQSAQAMLAQANQLPQGVLQLLG